MKTYHNRFRFLGTRTWIDYEYRESWGHRYYSFDGWKTKARTKREALKLAGIVIPATAQGIAANK